MCACVPGVEAIDVLSDTEYLVSVFVKMSFISARFKLKTRIAEQRPPCYLRSEGSGEDASMTSSLKIASELFLTEEPGGTGVRTLLDVEMFGRLGTFGLHMIKTKADRMWEEFGRNLSGRLAA